MGSRLIEEAYDLQIRERTLQLGTRTSPAGWDIVIPGTEKRITEVRVWTWTKDDAEAIVGALQVAKDES